MTRTPKTLQTDSTLYHNTSLANLHSVLRNGIQPTEHTHREKLEEDLTDIAIENDIELPITRQDCVFFYATAEQAEILTRFESDMAEESTLVEKGSVVIVDGKLIDADIFIGEFNLISDAIDFQHGRRPDDRMIADSYTDALKRYADSLTQVKSFTEMEDLCDQFELPEVVIETNVPANVIIEYVV